MPFKRECVKVEEFSVHFCSSAWRTEQHGTRIILTFLRKFRRCSARGAAAQQFVRATRKRCDNCRSRDEVPSLHTSVRKQRSLVHSLTCLRIVRRLFRSVNDSALTYINLPSPDRYPSTIEKNRLHAVTFRRRRTRFFAPIQPIPSVSPEIIITHFRSQHRLAHINVAFRLFRNRRLCVRARDCVLLRKNQLLGRKSKTAESITVHGQ